MVMNTTEQYVTRKWLAEDNGNFWAVTWNSHFDDFMLWNNKLRTFRICEDISARTMFMGLETDRDVFVNCAEFYASVHYYHETGRLELVVRQDGTWRHITDFKEIDI